MQAGEGTGRPASVKPPPAATAAQPTPRVNLKFNTPAASQVRLLLVRPADCIVVVSAVARRPANPKGSRRLKLGSGEWNRLDAASLSALAQ